MNNKILFADLDRTLLCDDKSISEKNRAAIQKMLERGHYFVLATGRPVESGRIVVKDLGLTSPGCYMIAFNGAVIYDCAADRVLYKSALPIEVAQEIFDRAHKAGIYAQTYNTVDIVTKRHTKELDYYVERSHMTYKLTRRISDCLDSEPQKVILIHLEDDEKLKRFQKANAVPAMRRIPCGTRRRGSVSMFAPPLKRFPHAFAVSRRTVFPRHCGHSAHFPRLSQKRSAFFDRFLIP